jgi:hypothetical protein
VGPRRFFSNYIGYGHRVLRNKDIYNTIYSYLFHLLPVSIASVFEVRHDRMVVGFMTTCAISAYHHYSCELNSIHGEVYSIQHYVIKFVSDLLQAVGFFWG